MTQINKLEMQKLEEHKIIFNTDRGFVDKNGFIIGFQKTRNKRYIEDKYAEIAKKLL